MLVLFVGFSGVGKDTIMKRVIADHPDTFTKFPSYTTREPRPGETEGNPYCFITEEEFRQKLAADEIYEYNFIHGKAYYGGSKKILSDYLATGKILFKDVDVEGARTYREKLSSLTRIMSIYLYCADEETVIARLRNRGDSEESIATRRQRFALESKLSCESDYMVNNMYVDLTADIVKQIIDVENANGIYLPCSVPTEEEIAACEGDDSPVILTPTANGLMITDGAARYVSALRRGSFIQKKVEASEINGGLVPACTEAEFRKLIFG